MSVAQRNIVRHTVETLRWDGEWSMESSHRTPEGAEWEARRLRGMPGYQASSWRRIRTGGVLTVRLNNRLAETDLERLDALITDLRIRPNHDFGWIECTGTREELTNANLAEPYMFENLGKSRARSSCDEYGNHYRLTARSKTRFQLLRYFTQDATLPHPNSKRPAGAPKCLEDVDVGPLLARFHKNPGVRIVGVMEGIKDALGS